MKITFVGMCRFGRRGLGAKNKQGKMSMGDPWRGWDPKPLLALPATRLCITCSPENTVSQWPRLQRGSQSQEWSGQGVTSLMSQMRWGLLLFAHSGSCWTSTVTRTHPKGLAKAENPRSDPGRKPGCQRRSPSWLLWGLCSWAGISTVILPEVFIGSVATVTTLRLVCPGLAPVIPRQERNPPLTWNE